MPSVDPAALVSWFTLAAILGAAWTFRRGAGGTALSQLEIANRVLERANLELREQAGRDQAQIVGLRSSRDFAEAIAPLMQTVIDHEEREEKHFAAMVAVLEQIAVRLGADDGHDEQPTA